MIPLPSLIVQQLTFKLQLISSQLAAVFLWGLGIPLLIKGNVIDLGVRQLQVVDACSGLRYILSLFSLGTIYCYFYQRRLWKIAILLVSLIPASLIANSLRIALMGIFPSLQEGFLHAFSGWLIFIFCFAFLAMLNWVLNKLWPLALLTAQNAAKTKIKEDQTKVNKSYTPYLLAALSLVLVFGHIAKKVSQAQPVPLLQSFDKFPLQIGTWQGHRSYLDPAMVKVVGTDDYFEATYRDNAKRPISLWIGYFQSQNEKLESRIHSPLICLPGAGWKIIESKIVEIAPGKPVRALLMEQGERRQLVYYWYFQRGRWMASEYPTKLYMGLDGLLKHRNDGAIVRLIAPEDIDGQSGRQRIVSFANLLSPILNQFIPE